MSLSCMELQLDQWLLTKGRSSAGRRPSVFCVGQLFWTLSSWEGQEWGAESHLQGAHFLGQLVRPGKTRGL